MCKRGLIWLMIGISLVILGVVMFGGLMMSLGWDFTKLSTVKYETNTYELQNSVNSISIHADTAQIEFVPAEDGVCKVVCYEAENQKHMVVEKDGCLNIKLVDQRKWYEYIGINFERTKITVYLPMEEYENLKICNSTGDLTVSKDLTFGNMDVSVSTGDVAVFASVTNHMKIKTSTGDIKVGNVSAGSMDLTVSTGKVEVCNVVCQQDMTIQVSAGKANLADVSCENFISSGNTGDLTLKNVVAVYKFAIERTTGNVKFEACDAMMIQVKTSTGNVTGTLKRDMSFVTKTSTGKVDVPADDYYGGRCEVTTSTGDIRLKVVH